MKKKGMSLVEILIAVSLLTATMMPLWGVMSSSHQQVLRSAEEVKASQLAVEVLEQLEILGRIDCLPDNNECVEFNLNSGGIVTIGNGNSVEVKIGEFEEYMLPKLSITGSSEPCGPVGRVVALTIDYKSKEGRDLSYTLRGFISAVK